MKIIDACVTLGSERDTVLSVEDLLRQMDAAGVDQAVLHPTDRGAAVDCSSNNDRILKVARAHADRFIPAATANPWLGDSAVEMLRRAMDGGARMLVFAPSIQGFILGDELLDPLLQASMPHRVPVYVHTGPHLHATPWQLVGVAERFPQLSFIMGHSGASDFWNDVPLAAAAVPNIFLESSLARPFTFKGHLDKVGIERGIFGSAAPRNDLVFEMEQMREVFPPAEHEALYGGTLRHLIGGGRP